MSRRFLMTFVGVLAALATASARQAPQPKPVSETAAITMTAVIEAIDSTHRTVTLKSEDGTIDEVYCGPDVQRFDALKVGDKVTFKYYESMVYAIQKPGDPPPAPDSVAATRSPGAKPGGKLARQMTATVTVTAIDMNVPSISIKTEDGSKMTFRVENKNNLQGVKVGDKVQVTYTQALAISVQPGA